MVISNHEIESVALHTTNMHKKMFCPARDKGVMCHSLRAIFWIITHLNDQHNWSFGRIADWLDSLECDLEVKPTPLYGPGYIRSLIMTGEEENYSYLIEDNKAYKVAYKPKES